MAETGAEQPVAPDPEMVEAQVAAEADYEAALEALETSRANARPVRPDYYGLNVEHEIQRQMLVRLGLDWPPGEPFYAIIEDEINRLRQLVPGKSLAARVDQLEARLVNMATVQQVNVLEGRLRTLVFTGSMALLVAMLAVILLQHYWQ